MAVTTPPISITMSPQALSHEKENGQDFTPYSHVSRGGGGGVSANGLLKGYREAALRLQKHAEITATEITDHTENTAVCLKDNKLHLFPPDTQPEFRGTRHIN